MNNSDLRSLIFKNYVEPFSKPPEGYEWKWRQRKKGGILPHKELRLVKTIGEKGGGDRLRIRNVIGHAKR